MKANRWVWIVFGCALALFTVFPAAAQSSSRAVQVVVNAANNNKASAYEFAADAQITVTGVQNATTEGGESQHSCLPAPSAGTRSVWFEVYLVEGLVSISTVGTLYGTAVGNSADSVMSIYFGSSFTAFGDLVPIACNDNGSGAAVMNNLPIPISGTYLIQVSASTAITVTLASEVTLLVTHAPNAPAANDEPTGAKSLKFPALASLASSLGSSVDLNEPVDPALVGQIYFTLWYKFDLADSSPIVFQQLNTSSSIDLWFSIFEDSGGSLVIPSGDINASPGFLSALLDAGSYYVRVGQTSPDSPPLTEQVIATGYLVPNSYDFSVDGYEDTNTSGLPVADLTGWSVKNGDPGETAVCDVAVPYNCYFVFSSSGALEATQLKAKVQLTGHKVKAGDVFTFNASATLVGVPDLAMSVKLVDAAGASIKFSKDFNTDIDTFIQAIELAPSSLKPVRAVIKIKNNDTDFGDLVRLDGFVAGVLRLGEFYGRFTTALSGLKLTLPELWSDAAGADVLPVPAAPAPSAGWR